MDIPGQITFYIFYHFHTITIGENGLKFLLELCKRYSHLFTLFGVLTGLYFLVAIVLLYLYDAVRY